ncbi:MAG: flagellar motor switch protein FliN, partial [bacterium]
VVQAAQLSQLSGGLPAGAGSNLELLMDVPLRITVELGRTEKLVKEVLALGPGSVLELDKLAGEPVDILVNEKRIATGEVVVIDENFGIRVTEILAPRDRVSF